MRVVSATASPLGEVASSSVVRQFPPSDSFRIVVSFDSRYSPPSTFLPWESVRRTLFSVMRDALIWTDSFSRSPVAPVSLIFSLPARNDIAGTLGRMQPRCQQTNASKLVESLPARSTRFRSPWRTVPVCLCVLRTRIVSTECERELTSFMAWAPTARWLSPSFSSDMISPVLST